MMYVFEYMIYHLKAYGYDTIIKVESNCDKNKEEGDVTSANGTSNENPSRKRSLENLTNAQSTTIVIPNSKNNLVTLKSLAADTKDSRKNSTVTKVNIVNKIESENKVQNKGITLESWKEASKDSLLKKTLGGKKS